jgi:hypothetical protein
VDKSARIVDKSGGAVDKWGEGVGGAVIIIVAPQSCKRPIFKTLPNYPKINDLQYLVFFTNN